MTSDNTDDANQLVDDDAGTNSSSSSSLLFLETEQEREDRIARQLREERRKRLQQRRRQVGSARIATDGTIISQQQEEEQESRRIHETPMIAHDTPPPYDNTVHLKKRSRVEEENYESLALSESLSETASITAMMMTKGTADTSNGKVHTTNEIMYQPLPPPRADRNLISLTINAPNVSHDNDTNDSMDMRIDDEEEEDMFCTHPTVSAATATITTAVADKTTFPQTKRITTTTTIKHNKQEMDDAEGYYKASIGEILTFTRENDDEDDEQNHYTTTTTTRIKKCLHFKVLGIIGKGVFSTVLKCARIFPESTTTSTSAAITSSSSSNKNHPIVAIKLIRNNELMTKAAQKEAKILRILRFSPNTNHNKKSQKSKQLLPNMETQQQQQASTSKEFENYNIVKMLEWHDFFPTSSSSSSSTSTFHQQHILPPLFEYNFHTVLFFEHVSINLRELLSKFGKNVGINLDAVRSYAHQLFIALQHLQSLGIIHADLKLDNILVSSCFQQVKLCDFGSAFFESDPLEKEVLTPYLVSRFYRAPEIILGLDYDPSIDIWSLAVTLGELFTGQVVFPGRSNNDMLSRFMNTLGPFSHRMMKRHIQSYITKFNRVPHFEEMTSGGTYAFRKQDVDDVTGTPVIRVVPVLEGVQVAHDHTLAQILLRAKSKSDSRVDVLQLADFLHRCLALDPTKRLKVDAALKHDFFKKS